MQTTITAVRVTLAVMFALCWSGKTAVAEVQIGSAVGVGAGEFVGEWYAATDARIDLVGRNWKLGLGARLDFVGGERRTDDFATASDAIKLVRYAAVKHKTNKVDISLQAGSLGAVTFNPVISAYVPTLDFRRRVSTLASVTTKHLSLTGYVDDVITPVVAGASLTMPSERFDIVVAAAMDVGTPGDMAAMADTPLAVAAQLQKRGTASDIRLRAAGGLRIEPSYGAHVIASADATKLVGRTRLSLKVSGAAGWGTTGSSFGALYRRDRISTASAGSIWQRARNGANEGMLASEAQNGDLAGVAGSIELGVVVTDLGWFTGSLARRPGLGPLALVSIGLPMWRSWQAGAFAAFERSTQVGGVEIRRTFATKYWLATEIGWGLAPTQAMPMQPAHFATIWTGIAL